MKPRFSNQRNQAMTLVEVLVVIAIITLLAALLLPALATADKKAMRITCVNHLMQTDMSFRIWEVDHTNHYPMSVSTNHGGTFEYVESGEVFRHFQVMSNELSTPYILVCPADVRPRAKDFGSTFCNTNISYCVGVDADETKPEMIVCGDRNIVGGTRLTNGILEITTNQFVGWSSEMHDGAGNVGLADGSVMQLGRGRHTEWPDWPEWSDLEARTVATNRLAIP